jgi:hypothetical protein
VAVFESQPVRADTAPASAGRGLHLIPALTPSAAAEKGWLKRILKSRVENEVEFVRLDRLG